MPCFIKNSFLFKLCCSLINTFMDIYSQSKIKKIVFSMAICIKESKTAKFFNSYIMRNPYFINSKVYKFIKAIANLIDKVLGWIHNLFLPAVKSSFTINEAKTISEFPIYEKLRILAVFIAAVEFGFCIGSFFKGTLSEVSIVYVIGPVLICFMLMVSKRIIEIFKGSVIYKCIKFLLN